MTATRRLSRTELLDGRAVRLQLGPPPANLVDREAVAELREELTELAARPELKLVILCGAGDHFSYGASVAEHMPGDVEAMLPEFHGLLRSMNELPLPPLLAAVRGRCLGGGFELALACDLIAVEDDALLGCPEIRLAVFAPAASALLPLRIGAGRSAAWLLAGEPRAAGEALEAGLAELHAPAGQLDSVVEEWARRCLLPHSAAALRQARRAARHPWRDACDRILPGLEQQYLGELMQTRDALEGLQAFLDKRPAAWEDR